MAKALTFRFSQFLVMLGNGLSPETFSAPCGLTSRGFTRTANLGDVNVPDCADEDAPSWLERDVISYQASLTGSGVVASQSKEAWEAWWESGDAKNVRIELGATAWEGPFRLTELTINAERGSRVNMSVNMVSDGPVLRVST